MVVIGDRIKKYRESSGFSQKKLGIALGLSDKAISAYESNRTLPPLETVFRICEILKIPLAYLVSENPDEVEVDHRLARIEELMQLINKEFELLKKSTKT